METVLYDLKNFPKNRVWLTVVRTVRGKRSVFFSGCKERRGEERGREKGEEEVDRQSRTEEKKGVEEEREMP